MLKPTSKPMRALALRRSEKTWRMIARSFGTSQRSVKRWVKQATLAEQGKTAGDIALKLALSANAGQALSIIDSIAKAGVSSSH